MFIIITITLIAVNNSDPNIENTVLEMVESQDFKVRVPNLNGFEIQLGGKNTKGRAVKVEGKIKENVGFRQTFFYSFPYISRPSSKTTTTIY